MAADVNEVAATGELLQGFAGMRDASAADLLAANAAFDPPHTVRLAQPRRSRGRPVRCRPVLRRQQPTHVRVPSICSTSSPRPPNTCATSLPRPVIAATRSAVATGAHAIAPVKALIANDVPCDGQIYEGARHELLNETNRDEVTADIIAWLQSNR